MGSFACISASLMEFCRHTELPIYNSIAEALERMGDVVDLLATEKGEGETKTEELVKVIRDLQTVGERSEDNPPSDC
jgi:hypothetical protein